MELIQFTPNVPLELRMGRDTSPVVLSSDAGCLYTLADGRTLHVSDSVAQNIGKLKLEAGESFFLCLHRNREGERPVMICWLSPETEKKRAAAEAPELERQLAASLEIVQRRGNDRRSGSASTAVPLAPTGTEGAPVPLPAPQRKPAIAAVAGNRRDKPGPIPANIAFSEILQFVADQLKSSGVTWNDQAVQDFISTVWISGCKAGWITLWEREAA